MRFAPMNSGTGQNSRQEPRRLAASPHRQLREENRPAVSKTRGALGADRESAYSLALTRPGLRLLYQPCTTLYMRAASPVS